MIEPTVGKWEREQPAKTKEIEQAQRDLKVRLPESYRKFLAYSNGGWGDLPVMPGIVEFWPCGDLFEYNKGYHVAECVPGLLGVGTSGGGEMFAFDMRQQPWSVCIVPFIPMEEESIITLAPSFDEFLKMIAKGVWGEQPE